LRGRGRRVRCNTMDAARPRRHPLMIVLLPLVLGLASGCGSSTSKTTTSKTAPVGVARVNPHYGAPGAHIRFLRPTQGSTVAQSVHVNVAVTGFMLDPRDLDKAPEKGKGIVLFSMDGGKYDTGHYAGANGKLAVRLGIAGKYSPAVTPTITYSRLPPGEHTLVASLANTDLSDTGVHARVVFKVR
jgi:hypothetical protein